jgi:GGDEF domain-containing protein
VATRLSELHAGKSMLARLGGDEFGLMLTSVLSQEDLEKFAEDSGNLFRVNLIDSLIDKNTDYEDIREVLFDLLLVKFLSAENKAEEFFDSEEWLVDPELSRDTESEGSLTSCTSSAGS